MIFRVSWILIFTVLGSSWIISTSSGITRDSTIMKNLRRLIVSKGKTCPKKLTKFCKRESNLTQVLQEAVKLAIENCHEQFKYTRWNCTLNKNLFDEVSRESSVVTGIFAASLSHTFARSCVGKKFLKCNEKILENFVSLPSDDIKFGRRMARRILLGNEIMKLEKKRRNFKDAVSIHNVEVGFRVAAKMEETCYCRNYSSSCTVRICRKSLTHLKEVAEILRSRYTEAKMVHEADNKKNIFGCLRFQREEKNRFYYITPSPNFCKDTHGRECRDEMNCSILCCARGFKIREIQRARKCRCVMAGKCCDIKCQTCQELERKYYCK